MTTIGVLLTLPFLIICASTPAWTGAKDRSGPTITLQSNVYQVGNKWFCPLCRQEVAHGDRSGWNTKLALSEWHDVLIDSNYFDHKIRHITDEELVNSIRIQTIQPALRKALKAKDHHRLAVILHDYCRTRKDNGRLSTYDPQNKKYFITIDEFLKEVRADTARAHAIVRAARQVYSPGKGWTLYGVNWGSRVDFDHHYPTASKYGVHYLSFLDDQIALYLLTGDADIARAFNDLFNQWYEQLDSIKGEPVINQTTMYDPVWYELGLANRTQRLIDAQRAFVGRLTPETNLRLMKIVLGSSRWLNQCLLKTPFHPYNWQTHTAMTLSYAALAFPEFAESAEWLERGKKNMILHLENDIRDDGGYVERTPSYAEYMFSVFYRTMMMFRYFRNDDALREKYLSRLERFIEFFVLTNSPVGVNAPFNDASRSKSLVRVFREMGEFFNRGDFIGAVRHEFTPEALAAMPVKVTVPTITSIDFPQSRFVVMRDSWDPKSFYLILNYGEWQNHSHYDHLDFEIYANGIPIAIDAAIGKLGYLDSLHLSWYKHPSSHNMITINQAVPEKMEIFGRDKVWSPQEQTDIFAATHDGYMRYQKAQHRRHIIFAKGKYWLIVDEVNTGGKDQEMDFNLHTPCAMAETEHGFVSTGANGFVITQDRRDAPAVNTLKSRGWAGLAGLANEPAHREIDWLVFRKVLTGDRRLDRMATLICPFAAGGFNPAEVSIERLDLKDSVAIGYRVRTPGREDVVLLSDGRPRRFTDNVEGDFTYARISTTAGRVEYAGFTAVTEFTLHGVTGRSFPVRRDFEYQR